MNTYRFEGKIIQARNSDEVWHELREKWVTSPRMSRAVSVLERELHQPWPRPYILGEDLEERYPESTGLNIFYAPSIVGYLDFPVRGEPGGFCLRLPPEKKAWESNLGMGHRPLEALSGEDPALIRKCIESQLKVEPRDSKFSMWVSFSLSRGERGVEILMLSTSRSKWEETLDLLG
jgi:hypothetical protein